MLPLAYVASAFTSFKYFLLLLPTNTNQSINTECYFLLLLLFKKCVCNTQLLFISKLKQSSNLNISFAKFISTMYTIKIINPSPNTSVKVTQTENHFTRVFYIPLTLTFIIKLILLNSLAFFPRAHTHTYHSHNFLLKSQHHCHHSCHFFFGLLQPSCIVLFLLKFQHLLFHHYFQTTTAYIS